MLSETASIAFWIVAFVTVMSALLVVSVKNIFHAALFLVLCLFSVAGIFVLGDAEFLAAIQVLLYAGGVAVLMIFAVMLTARMAQSGIKQENEQRPLGALLAFCFLVIIVGAIMKTMVVKDGFPLATYPYVTGRSPEMIGRLLMTDFVLPFELVSVLLVVALIGAIVLAKKDED
jgi:NADH-quinone oxidoreductase subunit J